MNKKLLLIALGLSAAAFASADSLFVTGFVAGENRFLFTSFTGGSPTQNTQAGPMAAQLNGVFNFNAYCVDGAHAPLFGSSYGTNLVALPNAGLANSGRIAYLYDTFAPTVTTQDQGAGLQLAIWDVLMDNGDGFTSGLFRASSVTATITQANSYLTASVGHTATATWYQGIPTFAAEQDLIGPTPAPEPCSMLVLGFGGLVALRRRRRN